MRWSASLAYAIGLIATDGSLSKDRRHIILTSKDRDQIENFAKILNIKNKIGLKSGSFTDKKEYYQIQFGNVKMYRFLESLGLMPNKTKIIGSLKIPQRYIADFLRGHLDGDGYTYSYWDKRWKNSYLFYTCFLSASVDHINWIRNTIRDLYGITGRIRFQGKSIYRLIFAKNGSIKLLSKLYYKEGLPCLERKRLKIMAALDIIGVGRGAEIGRQATLRR